MLLRFFPVFESVSVFDSRTCLIYDFRNLPPHPTPVDGAVGGGHHSPSMSAASGPGAPGGSNAGSGGSPSSSHLGLPPRSGSGKLPSFKVRAAQVARSFSLYILLFKNYSFSVLGLAIKSTAYG